MLDTFSVKNGRRKLAPFTLVGLRLLERLLEVPLGPPRRANTLPRRTQDSPKAAQLALQLQLWRAKLGPWCHFLFKKWAMLMASLSGCASAVGATPGVTYGPSKTDQHAPKTSRRQPQAAFGNRFWQTSPRMFFSQSSQIRSALRLLQPALLYKLCLLKRLRPNFSSQPLQ